jgi:uncharacterized membrane protein YdbT with pleckstrin-like domain
VKLFGREIEGYAKTVVTAASVMLVAGGLCGLQLIVFDRSPNALQWVFMATGFIELVSFLVSIGVIVVVSALWGLDALYQRYGKAPKDDVQKLFDDERRDEKDRDE